MLFIVLACIGAAAALLHLVGYIPKPYRNQLRAIQGEVASKIGAEVEAALERVAVRQEAKYEAAVKSAEESVPAAMTTAKRSLAAVARWSQDDQRQVNVALAQAVLGPALPILRQFAPSLADTLEENPQLVDVILENPLFKKYVRPRIESYLGGNAKASSEADLSGWGT